MSNLPDAIWSSLKLWASAQTGRAERPSIEECTKSVESIAFSITGRDNTLPPEVVRFYATEALDMIEQLIDALTKP